MNILAEIFDRILSAVFYFRYPSTNVIEINLESSGPLRQMSKVNKIASNCQSRSLWSFGGKQILEC
jgi:hypothetical protein